VLQLLASRPARGPKPKNSAQAEAHRIELHDGSTAARAFKLLREGKTFHDLVEELAVTPRRAAELCAAFRDGLRYFEQEEKLRRAEKADAVALRMFKRQS
jgi:hypothetical protein